MLPLASGWCHVAGSLARASHALLPAPLPQLSTRDEDFIVDALALRSRLQVLNNVFADPRVVKVLHGCNRDIMWLQRDFGVCLVNVFDTGQAARMLQYPSFGLLHLLQRFCGVTPDKSLQRADWRLRPLSAAMLKYAREDTHYLVRGAGSARVVLCVCTVRHGVRLAVANRCLVVVVAAAVCV